MVSFEEFKNKYVNSNKELLEKLKPQQQIKEINEAYQFKLYNNARCKGHYAENKEHIHSQQKQYRESNKAKLQQYKEDHREKIQQRQKQYREANKEQIRIKAKQYYEANKDQIKMKKKENITCECGCVISRHLSRHVKTAKHNELLQKKSDLQPTNQIK